MNRSLLWAGLVAGLALIVAGSPARAGFQLQIANNKTGAGLLVEENKNGTFSVVNPSTGKLIPTKDYHITTATPTEIMGTATINGVNFVFDAKSNQDTKTSSQAGQVTVAMQVTNTSGGSQDGFSFYAADGSFSGSGPKSKLVYSLNTLNGTSSSGSKVFGFGVLLGSTQRYQTATTANLSGAGKSAQVHTGVIPTSQFTKYSISDIGGQVFASNGKSLHFGAAVATPEPTGVLLGVLGLPCMAGLVVWARRRRVPVAA